MTTLKALEYAHCHPTSNNTKDPLIKSIVKYRNNPCIFATGEICNRTHEPPFSSSNNDRKGTLLEIRILSPLKASQDTDTPTKVIEINSDIFTDFIHSSPSSTFRSLVFSYFLKLHKITAVFKNGDTNLKKTIDQLIY